MQDPYHMCSNLGTNFACSSPVPALNTLRFQNPTQVYAPTRTGMIASTKLLHEKSLTKTARGRAGALSFVCTASFLLTLISSASFLILLAFSCCSWLSLLRPPVSSPATKSASQSSNHEEQVCSSPSCWVVLLGAHRRRSRSSVLSSHFRRCSYSFSSPPRSAQLHPSSSSTALPQRFSTSPWSKVVRTSSACFSADVLKPTRSTNMV